MAQKRSCGPRAVATTIKEDRTETINQHVYVSSVLLETYCHTVKVVYRVFHQFVLRFHVRIVHASMYYFNRVHV